MILYRKRKGFIINTLARRASSCHDALDGSIPARHNTPHLLPRPLSATEPYQHRRMRTIGSIVRKDGKDVLSGSRDAHRKQLKPQHDRRIGARRTPCLSATTPPPARFPPHILAHMRPMMVGRWGLLFPAKGKDREDGSCLVGRAVLETGSLGFALNTRGIGEVPVRDAYRQGIWGRR